MLKTTIVALAMFGSVNAVAGAYYSDAVQDQKTVGALDNPLYQAVQDNKAVSLESQVETSQLLDLNESF